MTILSDNPIQRAEDDALGRADIARRFAKQVLGLDASEGSVVGILGAWGSGKTSFINLTRSEFERVGATILDFNPWMFSGAQQLVESFFFELSAQLKVRPDLEEVGRNLEEYGEIFAGMAWIPVVGVWIERVRVVNKFLSKVLQRRREGIGGRRKKLSQTLLELEKPIIVVLDDIDRLSSSEIRDIFKLVRLTASFPNIIYLVAFDRARVEQALAEQGVPGRDYLEKILQVAYDLPAISIDVIHHQTGKALDAVITDIELPARFDDQVWPDVFMEIITPLVRNMRDVRRYATAVHGTLEALEGQIALADVLALEAVRVFLPDVFERILHCINALTSVSDRSLFQRQNDDSLKLKIDDLLIAGESHREVVKSMINRLFPASMRYIGNTIYGVDWLARWLRERRVAHEDILRLYLERTASANLHAFTDAETAWLCFADESDLDEYLRSLDADRLQDVIRSLELFEDQYSQSHVVPTSVVLLNLLPDIPDRPRSIFDFGVSIAVTRVVLRLVRSLKDPATIESTVRQILPRLNTQSARLELIHLVGYRENVGHKLIKEEAATELEGQWFEEMRSIPIADLNLKREYHLLRMLLRVIRETNSDDSPFVLPDSPQLTLALLNATHGEGLSQGLDTRAVRRSPRLSWDLLIEVFGSEESLKERIETLKASQPENAIELLELADKYMAGWRPNDFGDN